MFKLYSDKADTFECKINLEGASLDKSKARLVVETADYNLMFNGSISKNGTCTVPILKLKNLLPEGATGKVRLEVIADETFFTPWDSDFELKAAKSVTVEVISKQENIIDNSKKIQISDVKTAVIEPKVENKIEEKIIQESPAKKFSDILKRHGVTSETFRKNKKIVPVLKKYMSETEVKDARTFITEVAGYLK